MKYTTTMRINHGDRLRQYTIENEEGETLSYEQESNTDHGWKKGLMDVVREMLQYQEGARWKGAILHIRNMDGTPEYIGGENPHWM